MRLIYEKKYLIFELIFLLPGAIQFEMFSCPFHLL